MAKESTTLAKKARFKITIKNPLAPKLRAKQEESLFKIGKRWKTS